MTFKRSFLAAGARVFLTLVLLMIGFWENVYAAEDAVFPENRGDILLIYDRNPDEQVSANVEVLVNMASAMGRTMDYGTVKECMDVMEDYSYIICYDLQDTDKEFDKRFQKLDGTRMVIGSSYMERYLRGQRNSNAILGAEEQKRGRLSYSFDGSQEYEELIEADGLVEFQHEGYENGSLYFGGHRYPFCSQVSDIRFLPLTDYTGKLAGAALMQEFQKWLWPYDDLPPDYAQYLVIDEVYPFMPADQLMNTLEMVAEQNIPYVISVMPVLENSDFPSMKQFCQVLAYAQKHNGLVILHAPIIHKEVQEIEELYEKLTDMTMAYVEHGVYPMGIEVPYSWTNEEPYREVLKRYRTVFVYDDGKDTGFSLEDHTNAFCRQGHQLVYPLIQLDDLGVSQLKCYSSALYLDDSLAEEELKQIVENTRISANPFMNLWNLNHDVWINDFRINYQDHILYLNGQESEMAYEPEPYDEDYDFGRTALQKISVNLQNQNQVLMVVVVVVIIIFASFIVYARIRTRRRFLYKLPKRE